ncbi:hypothetical protein KI387_037482, partial [Taxus chinensis]
SIPAAFVPKLIFETREYVILEGPSPQRWAVKLWRASTQLEFRHGWEEFVQYHAIEFGDFLVFKYVCRSYFKVRIFGRNGLEKNVISCENIRKKCCDTAPASRCLVACYSDEEPIYEHTEACQLKKGQKHTSSSHGHLPNGSRHCQPSLLQKKQETVKSAKTGERSSAKSKSCYISGVPSVAEWKRNKAVKEAYSFRSNKPFCLLIMKPSHVYRGFLLDFPKTYAGHLKLPKDRREVILVNSNMNEWHVRYIWRSSRGAGVLSAGWKYFTVDNNLEEGDICIFERVDNNKNSIKLRVHIFRVAKQCNPSKRMKGEIMDDNPALPKTHSHVKMKVSREDLATNLLAKEHRPEQGKHGAEQEEGKKKAGTENKNLIIAKSKCPIFVERCNSAKPPKKTQLCTGSSVDREELIGKGIVLSAETTYVHDMTFEQNDLIIISDSNDESHVMDPSRGALNLSPKPISEGPLMTNAPFPVMNSEGEEPTELSLEKKTFLVDITSL